MCSSSKTEIKYNLAKTIYAKLPGDTKEPCTIDVTLLSQDGREVIVIVDFNNKALKAYWTLPGKKQHFSSCLEFDYHPRRVANITDHQVVVTFWDEPMVAVVNVWPHLRLDSLIATQDRQCGVAVVSGTVDAGDYRFVFSNEKRIVVTDSEGYILRRIGNNDRDRPCFSVPWYLSTTVNNKIIVSDFDKGGVTCVTQSGEVLWFYRTDGIPRGVTCDSSGYVYIVEGGTNQVTLLTPGGRFISSLLWKNTKRTCIYGVAFGNTGKLYLTEYHGHIGIFKPIKHTVV